MNSANPSKLRRAVKYRAWLKLVCEKHDVSMEAAQAKNFISKPESVALDLFRAMCSANAHNIRTMERS